MQVTELLKRDAVDFWVLFHDPVFSAQRMAQADHVHGMNVAKPVVVKADGQYYLCVLAACCKIDFNALKDCLNADNVELATESELESIFPDCEIGAEPPFGSIYGLPTILDDRIENDDYIVFQSGTHQKAIRMGMPEYIRIEDPRIYSFSYHVT